MTRSLRAMVIQADKDMARSFAIRAILHTRYKAFHLLCVCLASYHGNSQLRGPYVSITFIWAFIYWIIINVTEINYWWRVITWRRSFAKYWKHFVARFDDVHASGYNYSGSVQIRMKFGALRVYCPELALTDFGRDPRRSESERAEILFFSR